MAAREGDPVGCAVAVGDLFGPTLGTAIYRLRNSPTEVARTLLVVMRRGSLSAAEEITNHSDGCWSDRPCLERNS